MNDTDKAFVYVVHSRQTELVKIGCSLHPKVRLSQLRVNDKTLTLQHTTEFPYYGWALSAEGLVHAKLYPLRVRGEWFCTSVEESVRHLSWLTARIFRDNCIPLPDLLVEEGWLKEFKRLW